MKIMQRLDIYDDFPQDMLEYLRRNGWHFSKEMCDWAVGRMVDRDGNRHTPIGKENVDAYLNESGVRVVNDVLYDVTYWFNMRYSDNFGEGASLKTIDDVCLAVKEDLDDVDGSRTKALDQFVGRCIGAGIPIPWADVL